MVIFHSYVSLPEGTCLPLIKHGLPEISTRSNGAFPFFHIHFWWGFPSGPPCLMTREGTTKTRLLPQHRLLFERDFISLQLQWKWKIHGFSCRKSRTLDPPLRFGAHFVKKMLEKSGRGGKSGSKSRTQNGWCALRYIGNCVHATSLFQYVWIHTKDGLQIQQPGNKNGGLDLQKSQNHQSSPQNRATHNQKKPPQCRLDKHHWAIARRHSWWHPHLHSPGSLGVMWWSNESKKCQPWIKENQRASKFGGGWRGTLENFWKFSVLQIIPKWYVPDM